MQGSLPTRILLKLPQLCINRYNKERPPKAVLLRAVFQWDSDTDALRRLLARVYTRTADALNFGGTDPEDFAAAVREDEPVSLGMRRSTGRHCLGGAILELDVEGLKCHLIELSTSGANTNVRSLGYLCDWAARARDYSYVRSSSRMPMPSHAEASKS